MFELRDLWPESIRAVGAMEQSRLLDWLERLELYLYRKADLIVSVTRSFRDDLDRRGIDPAKVVVITNGVDAERFRPSPKDEALVAELGLRDKFVAGYIGTHGMAHGLETILDAASILQATPGGERFRFLLIGDGASKEKLKATSRTLGLHNVQFIDTVSKDQIARYWSLLDTSIIHLRKNDLFKTVIPSKLFECMAMGIPVLHGVEGESAQIVADEAVGLTFEPEDPQALVAAMQRLSDDDALRSSLSEAGRRGASHYDRKALARQMLEDVEGLFVVLGPGSNEACARLSASNSQHYFQLGGSGSNEGAFGGRPSNVRV